MAREAERQEALAEVAEHERELETLLTILKRREREPLDWVTEFASVGLFQPTPYVPPPDIPSLEHATRALAERHPAWRWWATIAASGIGAWLAPQLPLKGALVGVAMLVFGHLIAVRRRFPNAASKLLTAQQQAYSVADAEARAAHEAEQSALEVVHREAEELRARLRAIEQTEDLQLAAEALEIELSNEDLGVATVFEIGFEDLRHVTLSVDVPPLDDMPAETARVTKAGKLSQRKMAQRDRSALYQAVCSGVVLRLVFETFRVLPFVSRVQAVGMVPTPGLGGVDHRYPGLTLSTTRSAFLGMDLDEGEPAAILRHLGGELSASRDGTLKPVVTTPL